MKTISYTDWGDTVKARNDILKLTTINERSVKAIIDNAVKKISDRNFLVHLSSYLLSITMDESLLINNQVSGVNIENCRLGMDYIKTLIQHT